VDIVLLDWTRMGQSYCLGAAALERGTWRVVRPLMLRRKDQGPRNGAGWSAFLMDRHTRWEVFGVVGPVPAGPEPPHLEDLWVRALEPRRRPAPPEQRRAILAATTPPPGEPLFGVGLEKSRHGAFALPGTGGRSLVTVRVPADAVHFAPHRNDATGATDVRVTLPVPDLGERILPVKDHHLLSRAERAAAGPDDRARLLQDAVRAMGPTLAVRLGLSRPHAYGAGPPVCWLMADGFFAWDDPQP
jgi:hypothetical protein